MAGRLGIDDVSPVVSCGHYPSKAVVGEHLPVRATVWRDGHDAVAAAVVWKPAGGSVPAQQIRMSPDAGDPDRWTARVLPDAEGLWTYRVDAWSDPWATWRRAVQAKLEAGQSSDELANDLQTGVELLSRVSQRPQEAPNHELLTAAAAALADTALPVPARLAVALSEPIETIMAERPVRELITQGPEYQVWVDRRRALFGSWYELFPRSTGGRDETGRAVHGSFVTATKELDRIAQMGFDVVYLPPIHPIGEVHRKGANNSETAEPDDVGSPWAIGSRHGGHDAIHPELGTMEEFEAFVAQTRELGMEVALDFALQTAPDHPWLREHPEWFTTRPDGSIAYAENPPKRYQDIYPLNFDDDPKGIYAEMLRVLLFWVEHGVRIFRVDNPHTKPPDFWEWLIWQVKARHPDVLFLAEAFTRPARLYGLARLGFTQSYTYFTWRVTKQELTEFGQEIAARADESRPNLFVNTPDILHATLQHGGPRMFAIRAALAATLSPSWGVYSGYELFEHQAVAPGSEEYLDSEKYQLRPRDFDAALGAGKSLQPWITKLNELRRAHPALQQLREITFHHVDNDALIAYSKTDPGTGDAVIVVVNLNPSAPEQATLWLDQPAMGMSWGQNFLVRDGVTGESYPWGQANFVRLEPWKAVAHVMHVLR